MKTITKTTFTNFQDLRAFVHKSVNFGLGDDGNFSEAHRVARQAQRLLNDLGEGEGVRPNALLTQALIREGWDPEDFGL